MANNGEREKDPHTGRETTGHEWDGIKELDTPLPRWWLYLFYACIAAAIVMWVLMPAWPLANGYTKGILNQSDRANVASDIASLKSARSASFDKLRTSGYKQIIADPQLSEFARAAGESAFGDNCRTCHGAGGAGRAGYPNLADDVWIWGGTLEDIEHTIKVGVRSPHPETRFSMMPAFGKDGLLSGPQISDLTEYVLSLSAARTREHAVMSAAARGAPLFQEQCVACHGSAGEGLRAVGAPALNDDIWLYGGSRAEVRKQIEMGRGGVMPTWESRFDEGTIRALAVYVYSLGGGEESPPAAPATQAAADPAAAKVEPVAAKAATPQQ